MRTLYAPDAPFMVKGSLNVKITNSERTNKLPELERGVASARPTSESPRAAAGFEAARDHHRRGQVRRLNGPVPVDSIQSGERDRDGAYQPAEGVAEHSRASASRQTSVRLRYPVGWHTALIYANPFLWLWINPPLDSFSTGVVLLPPPLARRNASESGQS